jgi:hypothetical protein
MSHNRKNNWRMTLITQYGDELWKEFPTKKEAMKYGEDMYFESGSSLRGILTKVK